LPAKTENSDNAEQLRADFLKIRAAECSQGKLSSPSSTHFKTKMFQSADALNGAVAVKEYS
jgi:hypothetical protein